MDKSGRTAEGRWEHPAFFAIFDQTDRIAAFAAMSPILLFRRAQEGKKVINKSEFLRDLSEE